MKSIDLCALCGNEHLSTLWELPSLPLSETYGEFEQNFPAFDQVLMICERCGHIQLKNQIAPDILYGSNAYNYVTHKSGSSKQRLQCFHDFVFSHLAITPQHLLDIGGNDSTLVRKFTADQKTVIDPSAKHGKDDGEVRILNDFIENIDLSQVDPDVVLCTHTLEHIASPSDFICLLLEQCSESTQFFFEVPCFQRQIEANRLDAVFHQHYHYFHPSSLKYLVERCGGELLAARYNDHPTCGGSIMFSFVKAKAKKNTLVFGNSNQLKQAFEESRFRFESYNEIASEWLVKQNTVYGFGASLLLPVIFYHLGEASKKISIVLDDDPTKVGITYKNIKKLNICNTDSVQLASKDGLFITTYENQQKLIPLLLKRYRANVFQKVLS